MAKLSIGCIICGEPVELTDYEQYCLENDHDIGARVCDNCKDLMKWLKEAKMDLEEIYTDLKNIDTTQPQKSNKEKVKWN